MGDANKVEPSGDGVRNQMVNQQAKVSAWQTTDGTLFPMHEVNSAIAHQRQMKAEAEIQNWVEEYCMRPEDVADLLVSHDCEIADYL
jgi:phage gp36-like protein